MPPAPVRVPSQWTLAPSVTSVTSVANDKGDNEMILGTVHRSPGICLTVEENPQKTSARSQSDEGAVRPVGSHSTPGREKERIKEKTGCDMCMHTKDLNYCSYEFGRYFLLEIKEIYSF